MAYGDIKDLARRTAAGIQYYKTKHLILHLKVFKRPKNDGCQRGLASIVYKSFLIKKGLLE